MEVKQNFVFQDKFAYGKAVIILEKTYFIATLIFGWFITLSLAVFTYFAFKLDYPIIGIGIIVITVASAVVNSLMYRKWRNPSTGI